jgi:intein/homing endonuclease
VVAETTLAYLAGLIDGEGYIGVKKTNAKNSVSPLYHERIQMRMVHEGAIALLASTLGGNYYRERPHANNGRPLYCYQASDAKAAEILERLLPYLVVKREAAENVLRLRASKNDPRARRRGGMTQRRLMAPEVLAEREAIYLRAKELNRVGP